MGREGQDSCGPLPGPVTYDGFDDPDPCPLPFAPHLPYGHGRLTVEISRLSWPSPFIASASKHHLWTKGTAR